MSVTKSVFNFVEKYKMLFSLSHPLTLFLSPSGKIQIHIDLGISRYINDKYFDEFYYHINELNYHIGHSSKCSKKKVITIPSYEFKSLNKLNDNNNEEFNNITTYDFHIDSACEIYALNEFFTTFYGSAENAIVEIKKKRLNVLNKIEGIDLCIDNYELENLVFNKDNYCENWRDYIVNDTWGSIKILREFIIKHARIILRNSNNITCRNGNYCGNCDECINSEYNIYKDYHDLTYFEKISMIDFINSKKSKKSNTLNFINFLNILDPMLLRMFNVFDSVFFKKTEIKNYEVFCDVKLSFKK